MEQGDERTAELQVEQEQLRADIERSEQELEALETELDDLDGRLRALTAEGPRYATLARLCATFEELEDADASALFWGEDAEASESARRLGDARRRIADFEARLTELGEKRRVVAEKVGRQNLILDHLGYSLADAIEEHEARNAEWLVEREESPTTFRRLVMPWARGYEEDQRFVRSLLATAVVAMIIGLAIPFVDLPILERERLIEVPERVAKLVELNRPRPAEIVEPVVAEPEPEEPDPEEPEPEPEPVLAEELVPELSDEPAPEVAAVQPESTRERVRSKGILAFRDSFASRANASTTARLGSQASVRDAGRDAVGRPERSMVTTSAKGSSGGINLSDISRDVGGGAAGGSIEGVQLTQVATSIGGNGTANRPLAGGPSAGRTDEEIQIVFDRYKAALYRLYNRELRKDPTLRGQIVLRLTIEPDGSVSFCELQASDMGAPDLAQQIVSRVSGFDFGAKEDILAVTIIYPIDFLPAA